MSKKKKKHKNDPMAKPAWHHALHEETKHSLWAVFSFVVALILILAYFGKAGAIGGAVQGFLVFLFGKAFFAIPIVFFIAGIAFLRATARRVVGSTLIGGILFLVGTLGLFDIIIARYAGGYAGFVFAYPLLKAFDYWSSIVILCAVL